MTIKLVNRGETGELLLNGRLDSVSSPEAQQVFEQIADRFQNVILNMEKMDYISSAGLRTLKILSVKMSKKGGSLELASVPASVMEVLEMTGFSSFLKFRK